MTPVMGPANHAPGVSIMGAPGGGRHRDLMGGPDADPRVSVMGSGDQGTRLDVFGDNDLRFVDSLFTRQSSVRRHARRATISRASDPRGRGLVWGLHHLTTKEKP